MPKSRKSGKPIRKTVKNVRTKPLKANIVRSFLEMLNAIKLYHWKTESYSQHQATDELHEKLSELVDQFVEVLLGKEQSASKSSHKSRITMVEKHMKMMDSVNQDDFIEKIHHYRTTLIDMNNVLNKKTDSDLLNIRDEMLANINQFLYLLSFDK
jgi:DNA-binding ferritin-like protein